MSDFARRATLLLSHSYSSAIDPGYSANLVEIGSRFKPFLGWLAVAFAVTGAMAILPRVLGWGGEAVRPWTMIVLALAVGLFACSDGRPTNLDDYQLEEMRAETRRLRDFQKELDAERRSNRAKFEEKQRKRRETDKKWRESQ